MTTALDPQKILVIKLRKLGDVINTTPAVTALRKKYPTAEIVFLSEPLGAQVYEFSADVNEVWILKRNPSTAAYMKLCLKVYKARFDLVVDFYQHNKTRLITLFSRAPLRYGFMSKEGQKANIVYTHGVFITSEDSRSNYSVFHNLKLLQQLNIDDSNYLVSFPIDSKTEQFARNFTAQHHFTEKVVAFCAHSERAIAQVSHELLVKIANYLIEEGFLLYFIYGPNEINLALPVYSKLSKKAASIIEYDIPTIAQVRAILSHCKMYIGNDGGNKHLAVAAGIPTIGIFTGDKPRLWTPPNSNRHRYLQTKQNPQAFEEFIEIFESLKPQLA